MHWPRLAALGRGQRYEALNGLQRRGRRKQVLTDTVLELSSYVPGSNIRVSIIALIMINPSTSYWGLPGTLEASAYGDLCPYIVRTRTCDLIGPRLGD